MCSIHFTKFQCFHIRNKSNNFHKLITLLIYYPIIMNVLIIEEKPNTSNLKEKFMIFLYVVDKLSA